MSAALAAEVALMRRELAALVQTISPWVSSEEMYGRYKVKDPHTLRAMERRGDIPMRVRGRWLRAELMQWEAALAVKGGGA
jgi:hypothetical protein